MARNLLAEALAAFKAKHGPGAKKTVTGSTVGDMVVFPPRDAGFPARNVIAGVNPHTEALVDTRTVAGAGLAALDLDPLAEAYCARIGHHGHDHDGFGHCGDGHDGDGGE